MARAYRHHDDRRPAAKQRSSLSSAHKAAASNAGPITRFLSLFRSEVPTGYEDETGFHFGVSTREKIQRPSAR